MVILGSYSRHNSTYIVTFQIDCILAQLVGCYNSVQHAVTSLLKILPSLGCSI